MSATNWNIEDAQRDMRVAYFGGAPGLLSSGLIWLAAGIVALESASPQHAFLALFFGGMLIYPLSVALCKAMGGSGSYAAGNPLGKLAMEGTFMLLLGFPMAWAAAQSHLEWFFPAMLMVIGGRYLTFSTLYGLRLYWICGGLLAITGLEMGRIQAAVPVAAFAGAAIEAVFAILVSSPCAGSQLPRTRQPSQGGLLSGRVHPAMLYHQQSDDYRPLFWMQGRPIYANMLIIIGHIVAFVASALFISHYGAPAVIDTLALSTQQVWHEGQVWRLFSYVAFDPYFFSQRSLWFLISILLLYFFGREVEQFIGRSTYLKFYAALIFVPAILFCLVGLVMPMAYLNCGDVIFGVFVAFATIYPGAMPSMWLPVSARFLVWILLGVSTLVDLASNDYASIFMLWACSVVAYTGMRMIGAGYGSHWLADWLDSRRMQRLARQNNFKVVEDRKATESIDTILDKISKQGVGSLDAGERATLEKARAKLLKRDNS